MVELEEGIVKTRRLRWAGYLDDAGMEQDALVVRFLRDIAKEDGQWSLHARILLTLLEDEGARFRA